MPVPNEAVFEVEVLQCHRFLVLGVVGCAEPAASFTVVYALSELQPNLCASEAHADVSKQLNLLGKTQSIRMS